MTRVLLLTILVGATLAFAVAGFTPRVDGQSIDQRGSASDAVDREQPSRQLILPANENGNLVVVHQHATGVGFMRLRNRTEKVAGPNNSGPNKSGPSISTPTIPGPSTPRTSQKRLRLRTQQVPNGKRTIAPVVSQKSIGSVLNKTSSRTKAATPRSQVAESGASSLAKPSSGEPTGFDSKEVEDSRLAERRFRRYSTIGISEQPFSAFR